MPAKAAPTIQTLQRQLINRIIGATLLLLSIAAGVISHTALRAFYREVFPTFNREAQVIGETMNTQVERAIALGIGVDKLVGVEGFFDSYLAGHSTLEYVVLVDPAGHVLHAAYRTKPAAGAPPPTLPTPAGDTQATQPVPQGYDIALPVLAQNRPVGWLHVGVNRSQLDRAAEDSEWDILMVLLVTLLTTVEILSFLIDRSIGTPLRLIHDLTMRVATGDWTTVAVVTTRDEAGRFLAGLNAVILRMHGRWQALTGLAGDIAARRPSLRGQAAAILGGLTASAQFAPGATLRTERAPRSAMIARAPLFLYIFAEQLSTSFIPLYARSVFHPGGLVPEQWAIGLPITVFAGIIAIATPYGGGLVARLGARRVLVLGCIPAVVGYGMTALAGSVETFILCRACTAIGYAFITIACQGYLAETHDGTRRARNMAVFVSAVMTGAVCGTAIGAVLAERIGFRLTFGTSALITCLVGLLAYRTMESDAGRRTLAPAAAPVKGRHALRQALFNPRFAGLILLVAIPAKIVLSGFVFYLTPLYLSGLALSQPAIGRNLMLYGLTMLVTIPLGAVASDRLRATGTVIALAGVATGLGMLAPRYLGPTLAMPIAIALTGLCQGLASAPMLAIVPEICPVEVARNGVATLFGYLRLAERIGSIAGPLLAASLVAFLGYVNAISAIGLISLGTAFAYAVLAGPFRKPRASTA